MLKGKLTYILAFTAILWGVIGYLFNWVDGETAMGVIWGGLTAFGLRRAIK